MQMWIVGDKDSKAPPPKPTRLARPLSEVPKRRDRILCWILTYEKELRARARNVFNTWTKDCDGLVCI